MTVILFDFQMKRRHQSDEAQLYLVQWLSMQTVHTGAPTQILLTGIVLMRVRDKMD